MHKDYDGVTIDVSAKSQEYLNGKLVSNFLSASDEAFIYTSIKNFMKKNEEGTLSVSSSGGNFTTVMQDLKGGGKVKNGWTKEGFQFYESLYAKIYNTRQEWKIKKDAECIDYFLYYSESQSSVH